MKLGDAIRLPAGVVFTGFSVFIWLLFDHYNLKSGLAVAPLKIVGVVLALWCSGPAPVTTVGTKAASCGRDRQPVAEPGPIAPVRAARAAGGSIRALDGGLFARLPA